METDARDQMRRMRGGDAGRGRAEIVRGGNGSSIAGSTTMADGETAGTERALREVH
jgi:hypothetical protein